MHIQLGTFCCCTDFVRPCVTLLGGMPNRMTNQPLQVGGCILLQPSFTHGKGDIWMVFGDVTKMIGDAAADIERWVVL